MTYCNYSKLSIWNKGIQPRLRKYRIGSHLKCPPIQGELVNSPSQSLPLMPMHSYSWVYTTFPNFKQPLKTKQEGWRQRSHVSGDRNPPICRNCEIQAILSRVATNITMKTFDSWNSDTSISSFEQLQKPAELVCIGYSQNYTSKKMLLIQIDQWLLALLRTTQTSPEL